MGNSNGKTFTLHSSLSLRSSYFTLSSLIFPRCILNFQLFRLLSQRVCVKIADRLEVINTKAEVDASLVLLSVAIRDAHDFSVPLKQINPKSKPIPEYIKVLRGVSH